MTIFKECPFCGSKKILYSDKIIEVDGWRVPKITCDGCGIGFTTGVYGKGIPPEEVKRRTISIWNSRWNEMSVIKADILSDISTDKNTVTFILHGCNCFNKMKLGIAKYLSSKFPQIVDADNSTEIGNATKLGNIVPVKVKDNLYIVNCYTQYYYGVDSRKVSYEAIYSCLSLVRDFTSQFYGDYEVEIRSPKIGCGLAGGSWRIVSAMFKEVLPYAKIYEK